MNDNDPMGNTYCERCANPLESGQIGLCDSCQEDDDANDCDNAFDMVCPKCGRSDKLDVAATVWVRLTDDGTYDTLSQDGSTEWDDDSACVCAACGWRGTVLNASPEESS